MNSNLTLVLLLLCFCFASYGQNQNAKPIVLLANENVTTTIFFPSAISKIIDPASNFKFQYQNDDSSIGLLNGKNGSASNLTAITDDGYIYSFILQYSEKIETFNFILASNMAVGRIPNHNSRSVVHKDEEIKTDSWIEARDENDRTSTESIDMTSEELTGTTYEEPIDIASEDIYSNRETSAPLNDSSLNFRASLEDDDTPNQETEYGHERFGDSEGGLYDVNREEYYSIFCENNYLQKTVFMRTFRQNKRVVLKLNNILTDREEIYFVLQVENNSRSEYAVNGLSFFRKSGVGQLQKIMKPIYVFNLQDKIDPQSINEVVFVFKRFTISNKEEVYVVLDELENNRMVMLPLDNKQINAPTN